jgi:hypothetical protein
MLFLRKTPTSLGITGAEQPRPNMPGAKKDMFTGVGE